MTQTPVRYLAPFVGTMGNAVFTAANTNSLIAVRLCNRLAQTVHISISISPGGSGNVYLASNTTLYANGSVGLMGGDSEKHFLLNGDILYAQADTDGAVDVTVSAVMGVASV